MLMHEAEILAWTRHLRRFPAWRRYREHSHEKRPSVRQSTGARFYLRLRLLRWDLSSHKPAARPQDSSWRDRSWDASPQAGSLAGTLLFGKIVAADRMTNPV